MGMRGSAVGGNVAADSVGLYAVDGVDGVAGVIVMLDGVLTVADGLGSGVAVGTGLDQGVEE